MIKYFLSLLFLFFLFDSFAQTSLGKWEKIYEDSDIKVELQFAASNDSCGPNRKHKYKYRVTGKYKPYNHYLNWKMDYTSCNGRRHYLQNSVQIGMPNGDDISGGMTLQTIDYNIPGIDYIERTHYDVTSSTREEKGSGILPPKSSVAPQGVDGPDVIYWGESFELNVKGGDLGMGAKWVWYEGRCGGQRIDTGEKLILNSLSDSTAFYVRAEGTHNTTKCAWKVVTVDKRSKAPSGVNGRTKICTGESTTLSVVGGSLGPGAQWVWYASNCGGKSIDKGNNITITPTQTTTYLVRAEGSLNTTPCASTVVSVHEKSKDPSGVDYKGDGVVCTGTRIQVSVKGGQLSSDASWKWYEGACGSNYTIGTGSTIQINPAKSTTYYVRAEGGCNMTNCASFPINVERKSILPNNIVTPLTVYKGAKTSLSLSGGALGDNSEWKWYQGTCGSGRSVGTGEEITVRPRKKTTYFVKSAGKCQDGNCVSTTITPVKMHSFNRTYMPQRGKFFHLGIGLGLEYMAFSDFGFYTNSGGFDSLLIGIQGYGVTGDIVLHPVMKEWLSVGIMSSLTVGFPIPKTSTTIDKYRYVRPTVGMEMALGLKKVKALGTLTKILQKNDYEATDGLGQSYVYDREWNRRVIGLGLRIGRYARTRSGKRGDTFDVLYTLTQNTADPFFSPGQDHLNAINQRYPGVSLVWWQQSRFKMKFDLTLPATQEYFNIGDPDFKNATYQISFILNRNCFY